jgi:hypothetical protein
LARDLGSGLKPLLMKRGLGVMENSRALPCKMHSFFVSFLSVMKEMKKILRLGIKP